MQPALSLSHSFVLSEFLVSQTATRLGRAIVPTEADLANLKRLCTLVLQPFRSALGRPVVITSGLRPAWLNLLIGGSKRSAHLDGRAADLIVPGMAPLAVCRFIEKLNLPIDQVIYEGTWAHIGIAQESEPPRRQYLTARFAAGRTTYELGLHELERAA